MNRMITASFGVAVMPDDAGEPELLLREADRALYSAKNAGRNRVETVSTAPAAPQAELIARRDP
jgi:diguanylate cyclase (GGDEF)-like protein